ncbi:MAG TPA: FAD-dependent monooxygenase [Pseudonocardiaceae bacterium]|jgi:2-polyprenyl-6-methoxyphenol hydroxylase-like FAD-dependent oxidoreductase|nr:FAD-dependent monooxygenase [Pseudonocardiaceae bacterium]
MTTATDVDVLIAGAGPTGLTLAIQLARGGVSFRLVDKAAEHFGGSRGDGIQPRTLEVFDDLGIIDTIMATGRTAPLHKIYRAGEVVGEMRMAERVEPTADVPYPNAYFVPQFRTERILRDRLAELGGKVELDTELVGFEQDTDGVDVLLRHGEGRQRLRARYLVGADGGRSVVRRGLDLKFLGETDETARMMLADVRAPGLDHELGYVFSSGDDPRAPTEFAAFTPLYGTYPDAYVFAGAAPEEDSGITLDYLQGLVTKAADPVEVRLTELTWSTIWRLNVRMVERFQVGRVFLAGDAAHVHPPTGGQGLNTGVQDGYNLGWKLAAVLRGAPADLLDTYEAERLPIAESVIVLANEIMEKHRRGDEDAHQRGPETQQLLLNYRGGPLSRELRTEPGGVRAGDRAPDARGQSPDGRPLRIFELLRGPWWTVLVFGRDAAAVVSEVNTDHGEQVHAYAVVEPGEPVDGKSIVDNEGLVRANYQVDGDALVGIRPDGYLAFAADANAATEFADHLKSVLAG